MILTAIVLIQVFLLLFNGDSYVGAGNMSHFQIARYSFKYPEFFLDLLGKPVYTTLLAPFTLFGYNIAKAFNLIVAILTLVITARLSDKIFKGSSNYAIILTAFSPVYFFLMITCFPEVLFSLFAVVAVYLFIKNKFYYSAIVLSFIPFIRFEGIVLLPVFAFAYLLKREYWPILFLSIGTVFYTFIGFFAFGDWLWIMHKFPLDQSINGDGGLSHYIMNSNFIFGVPFLVLLVLGLIYWLIQIIRNFSVKDENFVLFILISGSWLVYFVAQSYVWWDGATGSLGLTRGIGAVIPLAALTSVKGIQLISEKVKDKRMVTGIISMFVVAQVFILFMNYNMPTKASPVEKLIKKSAKYIQQASFTGKVFYFDPEIIFQLGIDPYDSSKFCLGIRDNDKIQPSNNMEWGDLLVWDAHFGPNDGKVQLENLEKDPYLKKMESFHPLEKNTVVGDDEYAVQIFKKTVNKNDSVILSDSYSRVLSFENVLDPRVVEVDGYKAWKLDSHEEFCQSITLSPDVVKRYETLELDVILNYKALEPLIHDDVILVFSAENDGKSFRYERADLVFFGSDWKQLQLNIKMPSNILTGSKLLAYVWNIKRKQVLIKSLTVNVKSY